MKIGIIFSILFAVFVPVGVSWFFSYLKSQKSDYHTKLNNDDFTIRLPKSVLLLSAFVTLIIIVMFAMFFSEKSTHIIFYIILLLFSVPCVYLLVKALTFKIVVKDDDITVFSTFRMPYTFKFNEIASVVREVSGNTMDSEKMVIKTISKRKVVVDSAELGYKMFRKRIIDSVDKERLKGFNLFLNL